MKQQERKAVELKPAPSHSTARAAILRSHLRITRSSSPTKRTFHSLPPHLSQLENVSWSIGRCQ